MMSDEEDRSLAIHLEQVNATADGDNDHSRYQVPYSRQPYRPDNTSLYVRAARYQESSPFLLPEASSMLPTHEEEDEEDILDDDDEDEEEEEDEIEDDDSGESNLVDLANRAFIATCQKFARQNYPEFRRRAPYSFLENWHLHSMYSKSQQILLGIPHAQPVVLLSGDDFMFTPQLVQQQHYDRMEQLEFDWNEDDSAMDEDEDVLLVTARAPEDFMDENTWMSNRYSPPFEDQLQEITQQQLSQLDEQNNDGDSNNSNHNFSIHNNDDDEGSMRHQEGFTLSPEIVHWYRSAQYRPLTRIEAMEDEQLPQQGQEETSDSNVLSHVDSYQSLADMLPLPPPPPPPPSSPPPLPASIPAVTQDVVITIPIHEGYGSVRQVQQPQQQLQADASETSDYRIFYYFDLGCASKQLVDTTDTILDLIDDFDRTKAGVMILMFSIWRILFLCMESMLADIGSTFLPLRRHQGLSSQKASLTH
ncbi:hypothetical protein BX666DRAFT_1925500 [Dichotomocladium elegans]|nr:hypothetical protein BX666DRAFT_1925500 [Dichotomocladium elegans]